MAPIYQVMMQADLIVDGKIIGCLVNRLKIELSPPHEKIPWERASGEVSVFYEDGIYDLLKPRTPARLTLKEPYTIRATYDIDISETGYSTDPDIDIHGGVLVRFRERDRCFKVSE